MFANNIDEVSTKNSMYGSTSREIEQLETLVRFLDLQKKFERAKMRYILDMFCRQENCSLK